MSKISSSIALVSIAVAAAAFAADGGKRGRFVPQNDDFRASIQRAAGSGSAPDCCPADLNCNGIVDGGDLGLMLGQWGPCSGCDADLNHNGLVDGADLGLLLGAWGNCSG